MAKRCPTKIDVYYDRHAGAGNSGWAWRAHYADKNGQHYDESGPLDSTRRNVSLKTLARQARRAVGCARHRIKVVKHT